MESHRKNVIKWLLIITGTLPVMLGTIGIFLPLLPTTPFLLLAAGCYVKSSKGLYNWLITNKIFDRYINDYIQKMRNPAICKNCINQLIVVIYGIFGFI